MHPQDSQTPGLMIAPQPAVENEVALHAGRSPQLQPQCVTQTYWRSRLSQLTMPEQAVSAPSYVMMQPHVAQSKVPGLSFPHSSEDGP